jgi:hypothetical protein
MTLNQGDKPMSIKNTLEQVDKLPSGYNTHSFIYSLSVRQFNEGFPSIEDLKSVAAYIRKLEAALRTFKCGSCFGKGTVLTRDGAWGNLYPVTCSSCDGTGLQKAAAEALKQLQEAKDE